MQFAWMILPKSVTFDDLQAALSTLDSPVELGVGPLTTQMRVKTSAPLENDARIEIEPPEALELEEVDRIHALIPDPVYYRLRYYDRDRATQVLKTIATSRLAEGPLLVTDGEGWLATGQEFLQRLEEDPEWWDWWRRE